MRNNHCFQILKEISSKKQEKLFQITKNISKIEKISYLSLAPKTTRKSIFTQQQTHDFIQTVRCKATEKYLLEQVPTLTQQSCISEDSSIQFPEQHEGQHRIDAIFTELQDYLIEVKEEMQNKKYSKEQKKLKCQYHLRTMKNLLHYIKQVTEDFLSSNQSSSVKQNHKEEKYKANAVQYFNSLQIRIQSS